MLCDHIVNEGFLEPHAPADDAALFEKIRNAHKFVLAPDFAQACDELMGNLDDIAKALAFCRLPYPVTWIEVAQQDRPGFMGGNAPRAWQHIPSRVGFLLEASRPDMSAWKAHLMWRIEGSGNISCVLAGRFDMKAQPPTGFHEKLTEAALVEENTDKKSPAWLRCSTATKNMLAVAFNPTRPDYGLPAAIMPMILSGTDADELAQLFRKMGSADWAGEVAYIEAVLAMMNARNVAQEIAVDNHEYNAKRVKRGKTALFDHHVLTIHPRQKVRMLHEAGDGEHAAVRRHFVRGHWKVRRTGIFFWKPFVRGRRGTFVEKEYRVAS